MPQLSGMADRPIRWIVDDADQVHRARSAARPPLRRHPARPAQVRPRARRRGVAAGGASRAAARRLPQAARRRQPLPRADRLCRAHVGAGDRRAGQADCSATSAARSRCGEMAVREEARGLLLPTAIFARWSLGPSRPDRGAGDERRAGESAAATPPLRASARRRHRRRAAPKISSGTASGSSSRPASAPARGRPAVSAATATASAARAGVPIASASSVARQRRAVESPAAPTPGTAASSSSGPKVSQCATILAAATLSSASAVKRELVEHAVGAVGLDQPLDRQQRRGQRRDPQRARRRSAPAAARRARPRTARASRPAGRRRPAATPRR